MPKRPRCANGSRRDHATGRCVSTRAPSPPGYNRRCAEQVAAAGAAERARVAAVAAAERARLARHDVQRQADMAEIGVANAALERALAALSAGQRDTAAAAARQWYTLASKHSLTVRRADVLSLQQFLDDAVY